MIDIVIDIETLGVRPGCTIIEIGACAIDRNTGRITGNFSRRVSGTYSYADVRSVAEGKDCLGGVESATASWWTVEDGRDATLRKILSRRYSPSADIDALCELAEWCAAVRDFGDARMWGNGPTFDLAILAHAYERDHILLPWYHYEERCVRTALEMAGYEKGSVPWIEDGPRHRALNDARHEARKLYHSGALGETSAIARRLRQRAAVKGGQA